MPTTLCCPIFPQIKAILSLRADRLAEASFQPDLVRYPTVLSSLFSSTSSSAGPIGRHSQCPTGRQRRQSTLGLSLRPENMAFPSPVSLPDGTRTAQLDGREAWASGLDKFARLLAERTGPQLPGPVIIIIILYVLYILFAYFVCGSTDCSFVQVEICRIRHLL